MIIFHPPPSTDRGAVNSSSPISNHPAEAAPLTVSLHWLTATSQAVDAVDAVSFISDYLEHGPEIRDSGQWGYTSAFVWAGGLKLLDNDQRPEMGVCLVADGTTCEFYGFDKLSHIYQALQFKATRIDLAADNCSFQPSMLRDLWYQDSVRTVCKPMQDARAEFAHVRTCEWMTSPTGDTFYMGSRSSTQFARCYNSRGATRFEMELKKERAEQVLQAIHQGASLSEVMGSSVNQFAAFVQLDDDNRARCTYLPFWRSFLDGLQDAGVVTRLDPQPEPTVERLVDWIEGQVAPGLAVYEMIKGQRDTFDDVRRHLRKMGLDRATPKHHALVAAAGGWHTQNARRFQISTTSLVERRH